MIYATFTLVGVLFFTNQKYLPDFNFIAILIAIFLIFSVILYKKKLVLIKIIIFLILGYLLTYFYSTIVFNQNIDSKYHNKYVYTTGVISSLIKSNINKDSFIFMAEKPFKAKLKLSIYGLNRPTIHTGERWQFTVKIKNNSSYSNLGSFDYEKWSFFNKINAGGYINTKKPFKFIAQTTTNYTNQIREKISNQLKKHSKNIEYFGIINAILIGDKSLIKPKNKNTLVATGTSHLSVISGLHLNIVASIVFFLTLLIFSNIKQIVRSTPIIIISAIFTLVATFFYMLLAGFSILTVRAFIMITVIIFMILLRINFHKWQVYFIALFVVLIINPLSVLSVGFWLSFAATGLILYFVNFNKNNTIFSKIKNIIYLQIFISILMSPVVVWFFGEFSLLSPLANLLAIPVFSIFIVPLVFILSIPLLFDFTIITQIILQIIDFVLHYVFIFLNSLNSVNTGSFYIGDSIQLLMIIFAILLLLSPLKKIKLFAIIIITTIIFSNKPINNNFYILDVGQGASTIFTSEKNAIIFDTGNKFRSGFNLGDAVINPFLKQIGITNIEKIIISHNDKDHSGGLDAILKKYTTKDLITEKNNKCMEENSWKNYGWNFQILSTDNKFKGNNNSCVIKISKDNKSILLTGDIEKKAEEYLIKKYGSTLQSTILIAPHHGSNTSSSVKFLTVVAPKIAIFSAGFQNNFKHPAKKIINRYKSMGIKIFSTICSGQISINLDDFTIKEYRKNYQKYYHRKC